MATLCLDCLVHGRERAQSNIPYLCEDKSMQDRHVNHIELLYQRLLLDRYQSLSNKKFKALLRTILQYASKVETFCFADRPTEKSLELPDDCQDDGCQDLQEELHSDSRHSSYGWDMARDWRRKMKITLAIITTTATGVRNLTFRYISELLAMDRHTLQIFNDFAHVDYLTQNLTSIRWKQPTTHGLPGLDLSSWLSRAVNIQRIYIDDPHGYRYHANPLTLSAIFGDGQLPKLMALGLKGIHSTQTDLYNLLSRHTALEQILLDTYSLKEGTWEQTIAHLNDRLGIAVLRNDDMARWKCNSNLESNAFIDVGYSFEINSLKPYSEYEIPEGQQEPSSQADVWLWKKKERPTYRTLDPVLMECWLGVLEKD